jgi:pSer/pThr/pTyr-binding forkhead associated (FHA) protein
MPEIAAAEPPVEPEGGAVGAAVSGLFLRPDALEIPPPPAPRVLGVLEGAGRRFELLGSVVSIGRDPRSDVPLDDPAVSGIHAQIAEHEGGLYVRDLGSRNGTYVNRALTSVPHLLRDGDLIHVGDTDLTFRASGPQVVPEPAATAAPVAPEPPAATAPEPAAPAPEPPPAPAPPSPPAQPAPLPPTPPAAPRQARLVVQEGPFVGLAFELVPPAMSVGRDPASDIALSEPTVSWAHARLTSHGAAWTLMDLGSTNGTRVNAAPVEPNREVPVDPGDQIRFGEIVLRLEAGG